MGEPTEKPDTTSAGGAGQAAAEAQAPAPVLHVAPAPHLFDTALTTRGMMTDVLIALTPVVLVSLYVFGLYAVKHTLLCVLGCLLAELVFTAARRRGLLVIAALAAAWLVAICLIRHFAGVFGGWVGVVHACAVFGGLVVLLAAAFFFAVRGRRRIAVADCSAAVTGMILALSLPGPAPWYVSVIGSFVAIGIGKVLFGGVGQNIFNPAMVGRAFVMLAFAGAVGASGYKVPPKEAYAQAVTQATPMTVAKKAARGEKLDPDEPRPELKSLLLGNTNGSLGETSAVACLIGGAYLVLRRTASWQVPAGVLGAVVVIGGLVDVLAHPQFTLLHHLLGGALLFGAFFIATDPATSPLTPTGKVVFGAGVGAIVMLIRTLSNYPEGVMFAVLLMNALVPLINRWTIPVPVGGPVPEKK